MTFKTSTMRCRYFPPQNYTTERCRLAPSQIGQRFLGSFRVSGPYPRYSGGQRIELGKKAITFKVKEKALKKVIEIEQAVTATLEHFDLVVETFDKTTAVSVQEVVGDFIQIDIQGGQEGVKAAQLAGFNFFAPPVNGLGGLGFGQILLKNSGQGFAKVIS